MSEFWRRLLAALDAGEPALLAVVVEASDHSPGTTRARCFFASNHDFAGTIGGGVMEYQVKRRAEELFRDFPAEYFELTRLEHRREPSGRGQRSGLICSGEQTNLYLLCRPERDRAAVAELIARLESWSEGELRLSAAGVEVVDRAFDPDEPGAALVEQAEGWVYREQLLSRRRLAIVGGGHCGQALARTMAQLDYRVEIFETRDDVVPVDFPWGRLVAVEDFRQAGALVAWPALTPLIVMTRDFPSDAEALAGALRLPFPLVGAMGSVAKLEEIRGRLVAEGFSAVDLAKLKAPVGLPIDSHTPAEIAISVAAQILALRHDWERN